MDQVAQTFTGHKKIQPQSMIEKVIAMQSKETSMAANMPDRCGASFVTSTAFGLIIGMLIFLNGVFILMQTDESARNPDAPTSTTYKTCESIFFLMFAAELLLR